MPNFPILCFTVGFDDVSYFAKQTNLSEYLASLPLSMHQDLRLVCQDGLEYDGLFNQLGQVSLEDFSHKVKHTLVLEGQCCIDKIKLNDYQQGFTLLAEFAE